MKQTPFLEDMGQVLAALFGTALSARGEARAQAKQRLGLLARRLQLVSRDEFEALHGMLQQSRIEQDELRRRLDALEGKSVRTRKSAAVKRKVNETLKKSTILPEKPSRKRIKRRTR